MVSVSHQLTEAVFRRLVRAQSKSKSHDGRRQRSHQPISDRKVRTLTQTTLLAVFAVVWFNTMPAAVFGHADQGALRNVQDTRKRIGKSDLHSVGVVEPLSSN